MFAVKRNAVIGFNLYCGGGGLPGPALAPASPGGDPAPPPTASASTTTAAVPPGSGPAAAAEVPGAAIGSAGARAAGGLRRDPPRSLIGCGAAGSSSLIGCGAASSSLIGCGSSGSSPLIGCGAAAPSLIGRAAGASSPIGCGSSGFATPEEELDGCESDPERGPAGESLPGTPPGPPDRLRQDTLELIERYLREAAGQSEPGLKKKLFPALLGGPGWPGGGSGEAAMEKALETLRRVGDGILQKHELAFQGMLRKLEIQKEEDLQSVCEVSAHVFSDGVTNWGRVVTLISFGAFVAKHLKSINQEKCISSLARIITDALVSSKREWLMSQGGWEGFVDFFRVEDLEGSIRNILMAFAGVAGLGASLAYMIRTPELDTILQMRSQKRGIKKQNPLPHKRGGCHRYQIHPRLIQLLLRSRRRNLVLFLRNSFKESKDFHSVPCPGSEMLGFRWQQMQTEELQDTQG
ncbi:induced myeloid leukemia cell differentiation protein Mcl-1 isoform X2 [Phaenicophaeus curvirostris]|uniref:induced myeloid leukemia cell differentiation protein Mcl-1 isoform X2 n=1 Tax=Phaenicophaeus curvirostris TaxID=33595 RepID=UPI0037F0BD6D